MLPGARHQLKQAIREPQTVSCAWSTQAGKADKGQPRESKDAPAAVQSVLPASQGVPWLPPAGCPCWLCSFADSWSRPHPASVGMAKLVLTAAWETLLRPSFDVAMPLPRKWTAVPPHLLQRPATDRKYFLTFMGNRYLGPMRGRFRSSPDFRGLHNGRDVIVLTHCG